ncbi:nicotinate-nucleotide pyrophosphorylase [carboxylating]-like [Tubulanus polymorphus]|uniref:nicotinate-nucleotide pyrophosphorylase [carboxylating]-like n=1 Tax=Tubulanus polymorphus TaxID=672921 RepID=UPI003DA6188F
MAESSVCVYKDVLHPVLIQDLVRQWLREDTASFDYAGFVVGEKVERAVLLCKGDCVLAGAPFVEAVFTELDCKVEWLREDGDVLAPPCHVAYVTGKVRNLLIGERVALNCLTRTSGVATYARALREVAVRQNWPGEVAGTRKTTPGFRLPEKYALLVGGISTHRYDLSSMIMLKDNHIWSAGNITQAVKDARKVGGFSTKIEVECRSLAEAEEAIKAGSEIVMLDNFDCAALHETAKVLKSKYPHTIIEASGGVTEQTIAGYMGPHVDVISLSKTTQGYQTIDFSFKILKDGKDPHNPLVTKN